MLPLKCVVLKCLFKFGLRIAIHYLVLFNSGKSQALQEQTGQGAWL